MVTEKEKMLISYSGEEYSPDQGRVYVKYMICRREIC
jgi:hypothetical protein